MSKNNIIVRLGDFVEILTGFPFQSSKYNKMPPGIRVVRGDNVKEGFFEWGNKTRYWDDMSETLEKYLLNVGDIIIGMDGSRVGYNRARVGDDDLPLILAQRVARLRSNENLDQNFLYYVILNEGFKDYIRRIQTGTSIPHISSGQITDYKFQLPSIDEQRAVARILSSLDDMIELNYRMNATLEAMAQAIFKSWFVDFDPVRAKMEGEEPAGMDTETAKLFPDTFEEVEGQEIPKGWLKAKFGDNVNIVKGRSYKSADLQNSDNALVTLKSFKRGGGYRDDGLKPYVGEFKPEQIIVPGELVVAFTDVTQEAEVIGKPAIVSANPTFSNLIASLDVGIIRPNSESIGIPYLYGLLMSEDFQAHIAGYTSGTTVLHLAKDGIPSYQFVKPDDAILTKYQEIASPIFNYIERNLQQSRTLAAIRDTLLAKLISGEIRVPDAMLEAAET